MKKIYTLSLAILFALGAQAQHLNLLDITPGDSTLAVAQHYSDSVRHKTHTIHQWGKGDERFAMPTMQFGLGLGQATDHILGKTQCWNYSFALGYNMFHFSTYHPHRPAFFSGAVTVGVSGLIQPEQDYLYQSYILENRDVILPNNGGSTSGTIIVQYDRKYIRQLPWRANISIAVPLVATIRIGGSDTHQLSVGIEPELSGGVLCDYGVNRYGIDASLCFTLRGIVQYRYRNFFCSIKPGITYDIFEMYNGSYPHVLFNVGWNF